MKKIIVSGATSMVGIALIKEAIKHNVEVVALDIKTSPRLNKLPKSEFVHFIDCDLRELDKLDKKALIGADCFYHFAWLGTSKEKRDDPEIQLLNVQLTLDCLKMCSQIGCKKFIGAGSQAEYGYSDGLITPQTPCNPQTSYGVAKLAAGKLGKKLADSLGAVFVWGRIFSVYGSNDNPNTMIRYAIERIKNNQVATFSSGLQKWNYLYEDDVGIIFYLLGCKCSISKVYCIASKDTRNLKSFIEDIRAIVNDKAIIEFSSEKGDGIDPDVDDLIRDIDWTPATSFCEGIKTIIKNCY